MSVLNVEPYYCLEHRRFKANCKKKLYSINFVHHIYRDPYLVIFWREREFLQGLVSWNEVGICFKSDCVGVTNLIVNQLLSLIFIFVHIYHSFRIKHFCSSLRAKWIYFSEWFYLQNARIWTFCVHPVSLSPRAGQVNEPRPLIG